MAQLTTIKSVFGLAAPPATTGADRKDGPVDAPRLLVREIIGCSALFACVIIAAAITVVANLHTRTRAEAERELRTMALVRAEKSTRSFGAGTSWSQGWSSPSTSSASRQPPS